ncbi:MAG: hypothetical protein MUF45_11875 [Spirosomaceae bacterium]|jgi:hypothetical protein|nr:hypothetical protein [Spirosomataceae bacterium]
MKTNPKNIMKTVVLAIGIAAITNISFAKGKVGNGETPNEKPATAFAVKINEAGTLRFKVEVTNPSRQKTTITLQDDNDNVLFSDYSVSDSKYSKVFDLSNLEDGNYTFVIASGKEKINKEFSIQTKTNRVVLASN